MQVSFKEILKMDNRVNDIVEKHVSAWEADCSNSLTAEQLMVLLDKAESGENAPEEIIELLANISDKQDVLIDEIRSEVNTELPNYIESIKVLIDANNYITSFLVKYAYVIFIAFAFLFIHIGWIVPAAIVSVMIVFVLYWHLEINKITKYFIGQLDFLTSNEGE